MEKVNYYPLNSSQITLFLSRKYSIHKSIINVPTSVIVHQELDMNLLEEAIKESITRWDSFGIRLTKQDGEIVQYFTEPEVENITRLDFRGSSLDDMESELKKLAAKKLEMYNKPMARIYLLITPEGYGGVFTVISHLIMDSWAISSFYKDFLGIYYFKIGRGDYPEDVVPYELVLQKEIDYHKSPAYRKAKMFWEKEFSKSEPIYTHVNGSEVLERYRRKKGKNDLRASNGFFIRSTAGNDLYWIEKTYVKKFEDFIKAYKLPSMQTLFLFAIHTYLSKLNNGEPDVGIFHNIARRSTLEEKKTGGTRAHGLCFRNIIDQNATFIEACHLVLNKQYDVYRHADFNTLEMLKMQNSIHKIKDTEGYYSVSLSFQLIPLSFRENLKIDTRWYSNGAVPTMLYINIMDGDGTGGLKCYYEYMANKITPQKISEVHESLVNILIAGCENPEMSLADLYKVF